MSMMANIISTCKMPCRSIWAMATFQRWRRLAGISKSDWSYSTLFADLDLDADQDIMITNGVLRDLQNNDFNTMVKERYKGMVGPENYLEILKNLPSNPVPNIHFQQ